MIFSTINTFLLQERQDEEIEKLIANLEKQQEEQYELNDLLYR